MPNDTDFSKLSDDQLPQQAETGHAGQGAVVEMMRRLKDATDKLERTTSIHQRAMVVLTGVIAVLTIGLVVFLCL